MDRGQGSRGDVIMFCQIMRRIQAKFSWVIVQLVSSPWSNQPAWGQEGMRTSQKSSATQRVGHVGPYAYMAARHMVGRSVTTNSPTRGIQIVKQVATHGGGQQFIS